MMLSPEKFALAIVSSSDPKLSIEEKLKLYESAYDKSLSFLKKVQSANTNNQNLEDRLKTYNDILPR